jgi:hypothetical protein
MALGRCFKLGPRQLERSAGAALGGLWASGGSEAGLGMVALVLEALWGGWGGKGTRVSLVF